VVHLVVAVVLTMLPARTPPAEARIHAYSGVETRNSASRKPTAKAVEAQEQQEVLEELIHDTEMELDTDGGVGTGAETENATTMGYYNR